MHIRWLILAAIFIFEWTGGTAQNNQSPKIALVLSGGGAKGFSHIGVLKVLEEEGIPIDIIVGTSMGAVVGGLFSIGYSASEIEEISKSENWDKLLADEVSRVQSSQLLKDEQQRYLLSLPINKQEEVESPQAAIQGQNVINLLCNLAGNVPANANFNTFPIRFACIGTDVGTGKEVIIDKGFFPTAIYASMTIPSVFVPIEHESHTMIDGGVVNNFPTDVAKQMGADIIIGVDIRNRLYDVSEVKTIKVLLNQLINFYSLQKDSLNKSYCTITIKPDISGYDASSFYAEAIDSLTNRGIVAAKLALPEIQKLKRDYNLKPKKVDRKLIKNNRWLISKITIKGNQSLTEKLILDNLQLNIPERYTYDELKDAIDRVYGLNITDKVFFILSDDGNNGKVLNLNITEKKSSSLNFGMRLNTTEAVSILINYSRNDYKQYISNLSIFANISSNPGFNAYSEFSKGKLPAIGIQLTGKYRDYKLYAYGKRINTSEIYYGSGSAYLHQSINKKAIIGTGVKMELFNGNYFNTASDSLIIPPKTTSFISNVYAFFSKDNLDSYYFPTHGTEIYAEFSLTQDMDNTKVCPVVLFKSRRVIKITNHIGFLLNLHGRAIFSDQLPTVKQTFVGGHDYEIYFNSHLPFYGIPPVMPADRFTIIGLAGINVNIYKKHYVSLLANYMMQSNQEKIWNKANAEWGWGLDYKYNSLIGPIGFTVGYSDWLKTPVFSGNIGMWF